MKMGIIIKEMNGNKIHYGNIEQKKNRSLFKKLRETKKDEWRKSKVFEDL